MLIVVDANELFSAMIAKKVTLDLLFDKRFELVSPRFILNEYKEHIDEIAAKSRLSKEDASAFLLLLTSRIRLFDKEDIKEFFKEACKISPDSDDIEYFALALKLNCPIWSEDKALKKQSIVKVYSTSELIKLLL